MKNVFKLISINNLSEEKKERSNFLFREMIKSNFKKVKFFMNYVASYGREINVPDNVLLLNIMKNYFLYKKIKLSNKFIREFFDKNYIQYDDLTYEIMEYFYFYKKNPMIISSVDNWDNFYEEEEYTSTTIHKICSNIKKLENKFGNLENKLKEKIILLRNTYMFNFKKNIFQKIVSMNLIDSFNNENSIIKFLYKKLDFEKNQILSDEIKNCFYDYCIYYFNEEIKVNILHIKYTILSHKKMIKNKLEIYKKETNNELKFKIYSIKNIKILSDYTTKILNNKKIENKLNKLFKWLKNKPELELFRNIMLKIKNYYDNLKKIYHFCEFIKTKNINLANCGLKKSKYYFFMTLNCIKCNKKIFPGTLLLKNYLKKFKTKFIKHFGYENLKNICFEDCYNN